MKVNIRDQIPKYLGETKLLTTKCCIKEVENLDEKGHTLHGATTILKQFPVHKCVHEEDFKPAIKCIKSMLGTNNKNRYFVASQDEDFRKKCKKVPGTPVLYLYQSAPTLEKPSETSENQAHDVVEKRMTGELKRVENLKRQLGLIEEKKVGKKKRKSGNPNPLSCLKTKKKKSEPLRKVEEKMESEGKKRKRKRIRKKKLANMNE